MCLEHPKGKDDADPSRRRFLQLGAAAATAAAGGMMLDMPEKLAGRRTAEYAGGRPTTLADRSLEVVSNLFTLETEGAEHLREIPPGKHVVFLTTHLSDIDMPIAIAGLAKEGKRNLKVAELSTHSDFFKNPGGYVTRLLAGAENSLPISHDLGPKGESTVFNPDDFQPMRNAMLAGDHMVVAAYFNLKKTYQEKKWELPEKGGYGGVYLAQITPDCIMVPVAVDIETPEPIAMGGAKPGELIKYHNAPVHVRIGKPLEPSAIPGVERFAELLAKGESSEQMTDEEQQEFSRIRRALRVESNRVMASLNEMLPEEKRAHKKVEATP